MHMQTLIMSALLIAVTVLVVRQHFALRRLYKISQGQKAINSAFSYEIRQLKNKPEKQRPAPMPELPHFIQQPQTRYIGGQFNVN